MPPLVSHFLRGEGPIFGLFVALAFLYGCYFLFSTLIKSLCVKSVETSKTPELRFEGVPFRYYHGKSRMKQRTRVPKYYILDKKGRHTAIKFKETLKLKKKQANFDLRTSIDCVPSSLPTRKPKTKKKPKLRKKRDSWAKLSPEEEEKD